MGANTQAVLVSKANLPFILAAPISVVAAMIVVKLFLDYVARSGFALFAWWRVIVGTFGLIALATTGVMAKSFGRGRAAGAAVLGLVIAIITIVQFEAEMPFGKVAGMGAKLLLVGGLAGFAASIVALIKPDRGLA